MRTNRLFPICPGKTPNYIGQNDDESDESEESSLVEDGDDEPSESDEEVDGRLCEGENSDQITDNEMPAKRIKTENWVSDGEANGFDDPISGSQKRIKRESDLDGQTGNGENAVSPVIVPDSNESDSDDELPPKSSAMTSNRPG